MCAKHAEPGGNVTRLDTRDVGADQDHWPGRRVGQHAPHAAAQVPATLGHAGKARPETAATDTGVGREPQPGCPAGISANPPDQGVGGAALELQGGEVAQVAGQSPFADAQRGRAQHHHQVAAQRQYSLAKILGGTPAKNIACKARLREARQNQPPLW